MRVRAGDPLDRQVSALIRNAAATEILPRFGQLHDSEISEKTPGELVTIADHECERLLTEGLQSLLPAARVVGEEACAVDARLLEGLAEGLVWLVDPLDGTANFASASGSFGVIVALAADGDTVAGWLYDPLADRMCFAARDGGAFIASDGSAPTRLRVPPAPARNIATLATQFMPPPVREAAIAAGAAQFELQPIPWCAASHYPSLALGAYQLALFQRTLPWDHAAGALLLIEAGGHVARWDGEPYLFHDPGVGILAAANRDLWAQGADALFASEELRSYAGKLREERGQAACG
jgi:fructose-1,6-bisphosphatase/inositol monophosphatase family enzyme